MGDMNPILVRVEHNSKRFEFIMGSLLFPYFNYAHKVSTNHVLKIAMKFSNLECSSDALDHPLPPTRKILVPLLIMMPPVIVRS